MDQDGSWPVLFDLNIVLDVLMRREPYFLEAARLWVLAETGQVQGFLAAHSFTTLYYLYEKQHGRERAYQALRQMLRVFEVATVDRSVIELATNMAWPDFEDGVQAGAASQSSCLYVITRNPRDYQEHPVAAISPADFLAIWAAQ